MRRDYNKIEMSSLFSKVKSWLHHLFHRTNNLIEESTVDAPVDNEKSTRINNFFEEYKLKNERRDYLLDLQKKYKAGIISEGDMNEQDRIDLENLYIEQNMELKRKIRSYDSKIKKLINFDR